MPSLTRTLQDRSGEKPPFEDQVDAFLNYIQALHLNLPTIPQLPVSAFAQEQRMKVDPYPPGGYPGMTPSSYRPSPYADPVLQRLYQGYYLGG
jgi:hypothetical protein